MTRREARDGGIVARVTILGGPLGLAVLVDLDPAAGVVRVLIGETRRLDQPYGPVDGEP